MTEVEAPKSTVPPVDPDPDQLPDRPAFVRTTFSAAVARHTLTGPIDMEQIARFINRNFHLWAERSVIWDLSDARLGDVSFGDWEGVITATRHNSEGYRGRRVAVVSSEPLHDGMIHALEAMASDVRDLTHLRAFRAADEAEAWIAEPRDS